MNLPERIRDVRVRLWVYKSNTHLDDPHKPHTPESLLLLHCSAQVVAGVQLGLCGCVVHCFVFWHLSIIASIEVFSSLSNSGHIISKRLHRLLVIPVIPSWIPFAWYSLPHTGNLFCFGDGLTKSSPPWWTLFFLIMNLFGLYLFGSTVYHYGVTQLHYLVCKKNFRLHTPSQQLPGASP